MGGILNAIAAGPTPVATYQNQFAQQRQAQANTQAVQQETALNQLKQQQMQRQMASQDAISRAWRDAQGDLDATVTGAVQNGALPEDVVALQKHVLDTKKAIADLRDKDLEQHLKHSDIASGQLNALVAKPEDQAAQSWGSTVASLLKSGDVTPDEMKTAGLDPAQYPGHAAVQNFILGLNGYKSQIAQEQEDRKVAATEATAAAAKANSATSASKETREAATATFELAQKERAQGIAESAGLENPNQTMDQAQAAFDTWAKKYPDLAKGIGPKWNPNAIAMLQRQAVPVQQQPEFDIKTLEANAMKSTSPQTDSMLVDSVIDPTKNADLNRETKARVAAVRSLGVPEPAKAIAAVLGDASDQIGKTRTAVATANAEAPVKLGEARINRSAALDVEKYKAGSAAYAKSGQAYAGAVTAADDVQKVLDLAGSGNKAAAANVPLVGVGALNAVNGIKRINSAEIAQYGTAGSLLDRIQGKLQGWTSGQPIPKDVLEDMKSLHEQLSQGASDKHSREVDVINKTFDQKFKPMEFKRAESTSAGPPTPANQKEYDALPKGAQYTKPGDPKIWVKQ